MSELTIEQKIIHAVISLMLAQSQRDSGMPHVVVEYGEDDFVSGSDLEVLYQAAVATSDHYFISNIYGSVLMVPGEGRTTITDYSAGVTDMMDDLLDLIDEWEEEE